MINDELLHLFISHHLSFIIKAPSVFVSAKSISYFCGKLK